VLRGSTVPMFLLLAVVGSVANANADSPGGAATNDAVFSHPDPRAAWSLEAVNAPAAWRISRGDPKVVIAILDNGILADHEDIAGNIRLSADYYKEGGGKCRGFGCLKDVFRKRREHGTPVAVAAAGIADNGVGTAGVCPACGVLDIRVDLFRFDSFAWAIPFAIENGAAVINMSLAALKDQENHKRFIDPGRRLYGIKQLLSRRDRSDADLKALAAKTDGMDMFDYAERKGVLIVAGAGNVGLPAEFSPFCFRPSVLCVGGVDRPGGPGSGIYPVPWSSYGWMARVSAPAMGVFVATSKKGGRSYAFYNGTSFAAPMVSGLAGLIRSVAPQLTPAQVRRVIIASAQARPPAYAGRRDVDHEIAAWRRAFLRALGKDETKLLDNRARALLLTLIPPRLNGVWMQSQIPLLDPATATFAALAKAASASKADDLCSRASYTRSQLAAARGQDRCAKAVGPLIDAEAALKLARSGGADHLFATLSDTDIKAARALKPDDLARLAELLRHSGQYGGGSSPGGFTLAPAKDEPARLTVTRSRPPEGDYAEWFHMVRPGRYVHHARWNGADHGSGPVDLRSNGTALAIQRLTDGGRLSYRRDGAAGKAEAAASFCSVTEQCGPVSDGQADIVFNGVDGKPEKRKFMVVLSGRKAVPINIMKSGQTGTAVALPAGRYDVVIPGTKIPALPWPDGSQEQRLPLTVAASKTATVQAGGYGRVRFQGPDPARLGEKVYAHFFPARHGGVRDRRLSLSDAAAPAPMLAGRYDVAVHVVPPFIYRDVDIRPGATTDLALPDLGNLIIHVSGGATGKRHHVFVHEAGNRKDTIATLNSDQQILMRTGRYVARLGGSKTYHEFEVRADAETRVEIAVGN